MKYILSILIFISGTLHAQYSLKVKREDNRFLFFQNGVKKDTIIKDQTDLFRIHFPDSIQHHLIIHLQNAQFLKIKGDSVFRLTYIPGMKYSLSKPDTLYIPLLEGVCEPSKRIQIDIKNLKTDKVILHNTFIVK